MPQSHSGRVTNEEEFAGLRLTGTNAKIREQDQTSHLPRFLSVGSQLLSTWFAGIQNESCLFHPFNWQKVIYPQITPRSDINIAAGVTPVIF